MLSYRFKSCSVVSLTLLLLYGFTAEATIITQGVKSFITPGDPQETYYDLLLNPSLIPDSKLKTQDPMENPYSDASSVLLLGDGFADSTENSIGISLSKRYSDKDLYATDINCPKDFSQGNLHFTKVDHTKTLPFDSGKFDIILLRWGLCTCLSDLQTCGGIKTATQDTSEMTSFLKEVIRVFNPKFSNAIALLHGPQTLEDPPNKPSVLESWKGILEALKEDESALDLKMIYLAKHEIKVRIKNLQKNKDGNGLKKMDGLLEGAKGDINKYYEFMGIVLQPKKSP